MSAETLLPPTAAQTGMWLAHRIDPDNPTFSVANHLDIAGPVDASALRAAAHRAQQEFDCVRALFGEGPDGPVQRIAAEPRTALDTVDLRGEADPHAAALAAMRRDLSARLDLENGPLISMVLFRLADDRHLYYQRAHHAVMDGYGAAVYTRRLAEIYTALAAGEEPAPAGGPSYADLVRDDQEYRGGEKYAADLAYWRERTAGAPPPARPVPGTARPSAEFLRSTVHIAEDDAAALRTAARRAGVGWPAAVIALYALYLHRITGAEEVLAGMPVTGRTGPVAKAVPGMMANEVPLRLAVSPADRLDDLLKRASRETRTAVRHQRLPGHELRRELGLAGSSFGPMVNISPFDYGLEFGGAPATEHNMCNGPVDDLSMVLYGGTSGAFRIDVNANPARYRQDELQAHAERLTALLTAFPRTGAGARAAALDACTPAERAAARTRGTGAPLDDGDGAADLVARFAACAARRPDRTAVRTADGSAALSYAELDASSDALAARLAAAGVGPEDRVAVALPRCAGFAVAALGVLKAGGCYVPLDPRWPAGRTRFVLADTAARAVIAEQGADRAAAEPAAGAAGVPVLPLAADGTGPDAPGPVPAPGGHPDRLAYAMYTSGSTGTPKGVAVTHRDVLAFTRDHRWALGDHSAVLAHSPHGFDLSVFELWMPLLTGGRVVVAPRGELDAPDWRELLATSGATALWLASGLFRVLAEEAPDCFTALERLWVGGDAVPPGAVRRVLAANPGLTVVNGYGPTETTVFATAHRVDRAAPPAATVPIGRPDLTYQERPRPLPVAEAAARYPD